jgi:hypothetical protein
MAHKEILDPGSGFKLGLFSANCSSGMAVTKVPERWSASWDDNLALAKLSDDVGLDFLVPIAAWIGYGGETNFHAGVLEPVVWAAGLLAGTKRITVYSTIHTAFHHPVVAAKQLATLDQIGHGRAGINVVAAGTSPSTRRWASSCRPTTRTGTRGRRSGGTSCGGSGRARSASTTTGASSSFSPQITPVEGTSRIAAVTTA